MKQIETHHTDILVIGNGFDLNQKLPTSYSDFINSPNFKSLIGTNNYLVEYLIKRYNLQKWIDVENELKLYSRNQNVLEAVVAFKNEFHILCNSLKEYLRTIDLSNLDNKAYSFKLIERLVKEDYVILDFNYTDTVKNILFSLGQSKDEIEKRLIKVHGSLETEIIFGIEDKVEIKQNHVFLRKAFNQNFTGINLKVPMENCKKIFFLGHSLGETDHMYFKPFFETFSFPHYFGKGKYIELYHYGEEGYNQLFQQIDKMSNNSLSVFRQNNELVFIDTSK